MPKTLVLLRLDEPAVDVAPSDAMGSLKDLGIDTGLTAPPVVDAFTGRGRAISNGFALDALDVVAGASLATRDCTVQAILFWDFAAQNAYGSPGTIVARGKGNAAAEYVGYALELRVVNAALGVGELRWWWQDVAGVVKTQIGGHFIVPSSGYLLLTATRHWLSSGQVELRYYVGERPVGESVSADGDIAGGTTGTFCLGTRYSAGVAGRFFCGVIDELRVVDYAISEEEVAATWDRLARLQPRGYRAIRDLFPPGAPIANEPTSRVQKLLRIAGHAVGHAVAQVENVRRNLLPDRAYGPGLERWEGILGEAPRALDTVEKRRTRLVAHLRQKAGTSIPGVKATVDDLVATDTGNLQFLAFDQTITEAWSAIETERWWAEPAADFTILANSLRVQATAANFKVEDHTWKRIKTSIGGNGRAARILSKVTPTTLPANAEVGVFFEDAIKRNLILVGLRFEGGVHKIMREEFRDGVSQGSTMIVDLGAGMPANVWLHLWHKGTIGLADPPDTDAFRAAYSTTSGTSGFVETGDFTIKAAHQWAGLYFRGNVAGAVDSKFDDTIIRAPCGERSSYWYVYRDPALAGVADVIGAHGAIDRLKHAHTHATLITSKSLLCDDDGSLCDRGPMGAT